MKDLDLRTLIGPNERIVWTGSPDKRCFVLESIFNPLLFFALLWAAFDLFALSGMIQSAMPDPELDQVSPDYNKLLPGLLFIGFHLMPVWMYLGGIIAAVVNHKKYQYAFTDQAVYIVRGGLGDSLIRLSYDKIEYIDFKRGVFDKMLGVGDIVFHPYHDTYRRSRSGRKSPQTTFSDIADFDEVYRRIVAEMQNAKFDTGNNYSDSNW